MIASRAMISSRRLMSHPASCAVPNATCLRHQSTACGASVAQKTAASISTNDDISLYFD